jgi:hypothetical protein
LVFLALDFSVGKKPNVLDRALGFYTDAQRSSISVVRDFKALHFQFADMFINIQFV